MTPWQDIESAPKDGTRVELKFEANVVADRCYWSLCDVEHSPHGAYDWVNAPSGKRPTHWRHSPPDADAPSGVTATEAELGPGTQK